MHPLRSVAVLAMIPAVILAQDSPTPTSPGPVPGFDAARIAFSLTGDMDLGTNEGELQISRTQLTSFLSPPIKPWHGVSILPSFGYSLTQLDFNASAAPFSDEDLHSLNLNAFMISSCPGSPWYYLGWVRAELASDFQQIDGDDFTFDLAAGVGYRLNPDFSLGIGAAVVNLNGDATIFPGIGFDWTPCEYFRAGLYGPNLIAEFLPNPDWSLAFRAEPGGGIWNITDDTGESRSIDLTSYRLGLFASRRLAGKLWLTAGGGFTVGNDLDLTTPGGRTLASRDPDEAVFGQISLRLAAW